MEESYRKKFPTHHKQLLDKMNIQRCCGDFCDVTVVIQRMRFRAHRCILSAASKKLHCLIATMKPSTSSSRKHGGLGEELRIHDVSPQGFKIVLEYIYTGMLWIPGDCLSDVSETAAYLEMEEIIQCCFNFAVPQQNGSNHNVSNLKEESMMSPCSASDDGEDSQNADDVCTNDSVSNVSSSVAMNSASGHAKLPVLDSSLGGILNSGNTNTVSSQNSLGNNQSSTTSGGSNNGNLLGTSSYGGNNELDEPLPGQDNQTNTCGTYPDQDALSEISVQNEDDAMYQVGPTQVGSSGRNAAQSVSDYPYNHYVPPIEQTFSPRPMTKIMASHMTILPSMLSSQAFFQDQGQFPIDAAYYVSQPGQYYASNYMQQQQQDQGTRGDYSGDQSSTSAQSYNNQTYQVNESERQRIDNYHTSNTNSYQQYQNNSSANYSTNMEYNDNNQVYNDMNDLHAATSVDRELQHLHNNSYMSQNLSAKTSSSQLMPSDSKSYIRMNRHSTPKAEVNKQQTSSNSQRYISISPVSCQDTTNSDQPFIEAISPYNPDTEMPVPIQNEQMTPLLKPHIPGSSIASSKTSTNATLTSGTSSSHTVTSVSSAPPSITSVTTNSSKNTTSSHFSNRPAARMPPKKAGYRGIESDYNRNFNIFVDQYSKTENDVNTTFNNGSKKDTACKSQDGEQLKKNLKPDNSINVQSIQSRSSENQNCRNNVNLNSQLMSPVMNSGSTERSAKSQKLQLNPFNNRMENVSTQVLTDGSNVKQSQTNSNIINYSSSNGGNIGNYSGSTSGFSSNNNRSVANINSNIGGSNANLDSNRCGDSINMNNSTTSSNGNSNNLQNSHQSFSANNVPQPQDQSYQPQNIHIQTKKMAASQAAKAAIQASAAAASLSSINGSNNSSITSANNDANNRQEVTNQVHKNSTVSNYTNSQQSQESGSMTAVTNLSEDNPIQKQQISLDHSNLYNTDTDQSVCDASIINKSGSSSGGLTPTKNSNMADLVDSYIEDYLRFIDHGSEHPSPTKSSSFQQLNVCGNNGNSSSQNGTSISQQFNNGNLQNGMNSSYNAQDNFIPSGGSITTGVPNNVNSNYCFSNSQGTSSQNQTNTGSGASSSNGVNSVSYSVEDVRKTILNVLSQECFDDDSALSSNSKEHSSSSASFKRQESLPLTTLLKMVPFDKTRPQDGSMVNTSGKTNLTQYADVSSSQENVDRFMNQAGTSANNHEEEDEIVRHFEDIDSGSDDGSDYNLVIDFDKEIHEEDEDYASNNNVRDTFIGKSDAAAGSRTSSNRTYKGKLASKLRTLGMLESTEKDTTIKDSKTCLDLNKEKESESTRIEESTLRSSDKKGSSKRKRQPIKIPKYTLTAEYREDNDARLGHRSSNKKSDEPHIVKPLKKRIKLKLLMKKLQEEDVTVTRQMLKKKIPNRRIKYSCELCGREFWDKYKSFAEHMQHHSCNELNFCNVCGMGYRRLEDLSKHRATNHSLNSFQCKDCNSLFDNAVIYKKHCVSDHGNERPFYCMYEACTYSCERFNTLEKHTLIHGQEKQFTCPHCSSRFSQPNGLRAHLVSCMNMQTYICHLCGKTFNRNQGLKEHLLCHSGVKKHSCKDCGATFNDVRNFKRHCRTHSNELKFACRHCDSKFNYSHVLKRHILKKHPDKEQVEFGKKGAKNKESVLIKNYLD